jgi:hypothetical protein
MKKDFIPKNDRSFLTWLLNLLKYIAAGGLSRFNIPDADFNDLSAKAADFEQKLNTAEEPDTRTKAAVLAKTESRAVAEKTAREFVNEHLAYNKLVSDADRENMQIPVHKGGHTPAPVADKAPYVAATDHGPRQVRFEFGESAVSKAKPAGQHGAEIASVIAEAKPDEMDDLTRSSFDTHTPLVLTFKESERGKRLWYAARWENTRGQKGPWGEIMSVVIP